VPLVLPAVATGGRGVRQYTRRYQSPPPDPPGLVVIEIAVDRLLGQY